MPSSTLHNQSPFELLFGAVPDIHHLRIFGCSVFSLLKPYKSTKLQPKTSKCIFLDYASKYKGFICYDLVHIKFYISRHVVFDESEFPYSTISVKCFAHTCSYPTSVVLPTRSSILVNGDNHIVSMPSSLSETNQHRGTPSSLQSITALTDQQSSSVVHVAPEIPSGICSEVSNASTSATPSAHDIALQNEFQPDSLHIVLLIPPMNTHSMQTRAKSGISKKKAFLSVVQEGESVDLSQVEPTTYKSALKSSLWFSAIE